MMNIEALDEFQKSAVKSVFRNTLVVSAPGSGKTTVIINRLNYLIVEKKMNPGNIVVITFTKAAAENMEERFKKYFPLSRKPFFGTFHSMYYNVLKKYYPIDIIDESVKYRLIKSELLKYLDVISDEIVKETINNISVYKTRRVAIEEFSPSIDKNVFKECFKVYEEYKSKNVLLDFDDLQIKFLELLKTREEVLEHYSNNIHSLLVDEFQDTDIMQINILQLLNKKNSIFAVGDEDQCIYSFRGSRPDIMVDFKEHFEDSIKLYLSYNYRSPKNIVELSKVLIAKNINRNAKEILPYHKNRIDIKIIRVLNESEEIRQIIKEIKEISASEDFEYKENAILFRTNSECFKIISYLHKEGLPFQLMNNNYSIYEHFIFKDLLAYIKLSLDRTDRVSFLRIINKPSRYVGKLSLEKLKLYKFKEDCFDFTLNCKDVNIFQMKNIKKLERDIDKSKQYDIGEKIDFIVNKIGYINFITEYSLKNKIDILELQEIITEFKNIATEFNSGEDLILHFDNLMIQEKNNSYSPEKNSILISTIHGVKGMEFKNVFILNCIEGLLPHKSSLENNIEEERRLFYVGITRTKERLFLCIPESIKGKSVEESRFVIECGLNITSI